VSTSGDAIPKTVIRFPKSSVKATRPPRFQPWHLSNEPCPRRTSCPQYRHSATDLKTAAASTNSPTPERISKSRPFDAPLPYFAATVRFAEQYPQFGAFFIEFRRVFDFWSTCKSGSFVIFSPYK
jgi:hypothetical protein